MRLNALVVDVAVLGPGSWEYLERVCARLPGLAVIVCTGPSSVAQRVRGLRLGADAWVTKPCHAEELICVIEAAIRRHRRNEMPELEQATLVGEITIRPDLYQAYARRGQPRADGARVRDPAPALAVGPRAAPRGDLRARVGLRDGPRRSLGRRVRAQAAPEAPHRLAAVELHPHALRGRLPVRARARRRSRRPARGRRRGCRDPSSRSAPRPSSIRRSPAEPAASGTETTLSGRRADGARVVHSFFTSRSRLDNARRPLRDSSIRGHVGHRSIAQRGARGRPSRDPPRRASRAGRTGAR